MNYDLYADKVKVKLDQYGGPVEITRTKATSYNPLTGTTTEETVTITGKGILSGVDSQFVNGTTVLMGDSSLMCYLSGEPEINDKVVFGNKTYNIVNIVALSPDGESVIYYKLQLRK